MTIAVHDPAIAANCQTWRIDASGAERTSDHADIETTIDGISAAYLGGTSWIDLVTIGTATASDPAAIATADLLFGHRPLPFCGTFF